jgi:hypothetical protein
MYCKRSCSTHLGSSLTLSFLGGKKRLCGTAIIGSLNPLKSEVYTSSTSPRKEIRELTPNNQELPLRLELDWAVENQRRDILTWNIESRERMTLSGVRDAKHHARHEWKWVRRVVRALTSSGDPTLLRCRHSNARDGQAVLVSLDHEN